MARQPARPPLPPPEQWPRDEGVVFYGPILAKPRVEVDVNLTTLYNQMYQQLEAFLVLPPWHTGETEFDLLAACIVGRDALHPPLLPEDAH